MAGQRRCDICAVFSPGDHPEVASDGFEIDILLESDASRAIFSEDFVYWYSASF